MQAQNNAEPVDPHDAKIDRIVTAMAEAGQKLAVQWGHQPWSDSWAKLVAGALLKALQDTDEPIYVRSEVSGEGALFCADCTAPVGPSCDYFGHGIATLGELVDSYANPPVSPARCASEAAKEDGMSEQTSSEQIDSHTFVQYRAVAADAAEDPDATFVTADTGQPRNTRDEAEQDLRDILGTSQPPYDEGYIESRRVTEWERYVREVDR